MQLSHFVVGIFGLTILALGAAVGHGQNYPSKPVRIVATEVGGAGDVVTRLIAEGLSASLGKPVIVDNRGISAAEIVAKSPPDGYTLLSYGSTIWISPLLRSPAPYDVLRDFAPITLATSSPNTIIVYPELPVKSVKELIAYAKARPGELNYGAGTTGSVAQLAAELFKSMAGVNIVGISYRGSGPAITALIGGQVQLSFPNTGAVAPYVKSGRVRALAVTTLQPSALAPGLPTAAASGLPGFESIAPFGIFAPAKTPGMLVSKLNDEIVRVLNRADIKERLFRAGAEVVGNSPKEFVAVIKSDIVKYGKVIKDAGIHAE